MEYKVGIGYDIHRLIEGRKLVLGGVEIPYIKGLFGHSDADVLLHAICDAILGALNKGDIGEHFPNTEEKYHNISSLELLKEVYQLLQQESYTINNIDSVVIADSPNISPFKSQMQTVIAHTLQLKTTDINIKATTQEGMGFGGGAEAIAAYAIVSLIKQ
jgi:2-C-methyl-D-erythritol 2,4-cyclodiphosphate synthase